MFDLMSQTFNSQSISPVEGSKPSSPKRWLTFFLSSNYARRVYVEFNNSNNSSDGGILELDKEDFIETYTAGSLFGSESKPLSKKEHFEISDLFKSWIKSLEAKSNYEQSEIQFLVSPYIKDTEGGTVLLNHLDTQLGIKPISFSPSEQSRLSFIGLKHGALGYRVNSRLLHINIEKDKIHLVFGDLHKQDKIIEIDFGIEQIAESIASLRKSGEMDTLIFLIKSNLYKFIEQARLFGKPQLIGFDEVTARLLSQILSRDSKVQRVNASSIQHLCYKMIDSNFSYWNGLNTINSESTDYASARAVLAGFILEGLGGITCTFQTDNFIKGYFIDKLLVNDGLLQDQFSGHSLDWQKSAHDSLMRFNPGDFSRSCQLAFLSSKLFDSSYGWLHSWSRKQKNILWLSAFFHHTFSRLSSELTFQVISQLQGISQIEAQLVTSIIALSSFTGSIKQSKYLDVLPTELQPIARKMSALVQTAKALDISGRSAVLNAKLEGKPNSSNNVILKVFPRLDPKPEIIQVKSLKKSFESQFDQKMEVEIAEPESQSNISQNQSREISFESIQSLI